MLIELTVISDIADINNALGVQPERKMCFSEESILRMAVFENRHTEIWLPGNKHLIVRESYNSIKSALTSPIVTP